MGLLFAVIKRSVEVTLRALHTGLVSMVSADTGEVA
jgi:hypothetical protein